jgi:hypothetical protein
MHTLRLFFALLLSFAILSVGSAAAAMSVNSPCALMQSHAEHDQSAMANMDMSADTAMASMSGMPKLHCMQVEKSHSGHSLLCKSGHDCLLHNIQLAHPAPHVVVVQLEPHLLATPPILVLSQPYFPMPDLYGLWRPPRSI